jgi:hypothetical protein
MMLSLLLGGLLRALPEAVSYFQKKADNDHELAMLDKQLELEKLQDAEHRALAQIQAESTMTTEEMKAHSDALTSQFQLLGEHFQTIGNKFVDGILALARTGVDVLNMLVRPATTYYFLALFGLYKAALLAVAMQQADVWHAILAVYTTDDMEIFKSILSFWFVGRVFDKAKQK